MLPYGGVLIVLHLSADVAPRDYVAALATLPPTAPLVVRRTSLGERIPHWLRALRATVVVPATKAEWDTVLASAFRVHGVLPFDVDGRSTTDEAITGRSVFVRPGHPYVPPSLVTLPLVSVCIPAYEMRGRGLQYLQVALQSVTAQDYPASHLEIIVVDESVDDAIATLCARDWPQVTLVRVGPLGRGSAAAHMNAALDAARGDIIKPLFQDDFLDSHAAIRSLVDACTKSGTWAACACTHTDEEGTRRFSYHPAGVATEDQLVRGVNLVGCPSVVAWPAFANVRFDTALVNFMDVDVYVALGRVLGRPVLVNQEPALVAVRVWPGTVSSTEVSALMTAAETDHCLRKWASK